MDTNLKRCGCGHINDASATSCEACGVSLRHAEWYYPESSEEQTDAVTETSTIGDMPPTNSDGPPEPGSEDNGLCQCADQKDATEAGICPRCDGRIIPKTITSTSTQNNESLIHPPPSTPSISVGIGGPRQLLENSVVLGRNPLDTHVQINTVLKQYPGVSRRHLWLAYTGHLIQMLDLGSRNGTWRDKGRLKPFTLYTIETDDLPVKLWLGGRLQIEITPNQDRSNP